MIAIALAATIAPAAAERPRFDHTEDVAVVANFLSRVRAGAARGEGIEIKDWDNPMSTNFASFIAYANDCQIKSIRATPSATRRLPIGVEWNCGRYIKVADKAVWEERSASVWVEGDRVVKVTWGKPPPIFIPPIRAKTNG